MAEYRGEPFTKDDVDNLNNMAKRKGKKVDEVCRCGHLQSKHMGLNHHGACTICECGFFTWAGMVYKEVLVLRNGDNVLHELRKRLEVKGVEQNVFLVSVDILKIEEFSVSVEVLYK